jgi:hypothetical protein
MDLVYGSRDHVWLSVHCGLMAMGQHDRFKAREVVVIALRERRSSGFSSMAPLGDEAAEMAT